MDFSQLGQAAAESEDQTQVSTGAVKRELPRAGVGLARFVEYIETGKHLPIDPKHKPAYKAILVFELNHPDHLIEINGKKVPARFTVRVNKTLSEKGKFKPLFNAMNRASGGAKQHMVQMLGNAFLVSITHNKSEDGKKEYANLDLDKAWQIFAPEQTDALSGVVTPIPVPEVHGELKAFLWEPASCSDEQIKQMWDSVYIDGTYEKDGKEVSKNYIQEAIQANVEFEGSRTQALTQEHISIEG